VPERLREGPVHHAHAQITLAHELGECGVLECWFNPNGLGGLIGAYLQFSPSRLGGELWDRSSA
jgi:hypothetical protein